MKLARAEVIAALRLRYDHYSADTVFDAACKHAGLGEVAQLDRAQLAAFRAALAKVGDRIDRVVERLDGLLGDSAATTTPESAKPAVPEPTKGEKAEKLPKTENANKVEVDKTDKRTADDKTTRIVLVGVEVDDGERVLVCGDRADLGNWDPEKARPMTRDGEAWTTTVELGDGGEFKFLRRTADGTFKWESGENRDLKAVAKIEASWQR